MSACLLCPAPAVADGLCVQDGARYRVARMRLEGKSVEYIRRITGGTIELMQAASDVADVGDALVIDRKVFAARAERKRAEDERIRRRDGET